MLTTTALLYSLTRRLFNERIGLCAAVIFSVTESAIFLGNFATYDAPALCLLAVAAWIVVRTATRALAGLPGRRAGGRAGRGDQVRGGAVRAHHRGHGRAGRLALPGKAGADPVGGAGRGHRRAAGRRALAGRLPDYMAAITSTTTARQHGSTPISVLLKDCLLWGALPFALAVIGSVAYAMEARTEPGERIAPPGSRVHRIVLGVVLTGTALLAPLDQIHLHTDVSFQKHIGFGLFFAAPMAGIGLARIIGAHFHRAQFGVVVWGGCLLLGMVQAGHLYDSWPNGRPLVAELSRYLAPHAHYLVEVSEVPTYYLMYNPDARARPVQLDVLHLVYGAERDDADRGRGLRAGHPGRLFPGDRVRRHGHCAAGPHPGPDADG